MEEQNVIESREAAVEQPQAAEEIQVIVQEAPINVQEGTQLYQAEEEGGEIQFVDGNEEGEGNPENEGHMATVQLGNLNCNSVEELAEHLPNIGIHFTCKKCSIVCSQVRGLST